jgi:geranylgeranyl diphosphate synthase type II
VAQALGASEALALNSAAAIELFHNAFLIHDDVQDGSEFRRGKPTLWAKYGTGIAVNVGNAAYLLALQRLLANHEILGAHRAQWIVDETVRMSRESLEGQALELGWIRDNVCTLSERDYLNLCLKKTCWYSFIYPMRVGAIVAEGRRPLPRRFASFGWYLGAAFQIQDDILNVRGTYSSYGKEICGDLFEGKRTLMLIHLLEHCPLAEQTRIRQILGLRRADRRPRQVEWILELMERYGSIAYARRCGRQMAGAAMVEGLAAFSDVPESIHKQFLLATVEFVVQRAR